MTINITAWLQHFTGIQKINPYIFFGLAIASLLLLKFCTINILLIGFGWTVRAALNLIGRKQEGAKIAVLALLNLAFSPVFIYMGILRTAAKLAPPVEVKK